MHHLENTKIINDISIHKVGNKGNEEQLHLSESSINTSYETLNVLKDYFLRSFKSDEYYSLFHEVSLSLNEVFAYVTGIFESPNVLHKQSINLAKHLYNQSSHPKIIEGEFYTVYFTGCIYCGETIDAIGLFKSENRETFLEVERIEQTYNVGSSDGINVNKLDKGCLIFNIDKGNGYVVSIIDNTNKGEDAKYWKDDFLHVIPRQDNYHYTHNSLQLCKDFVTKELPEKYDIERADQADILNKSIQYFKENDSFDIKEYKDKVLEEEQLIESFNKFKNRFQEENEIIIDEQFEISNSALKKQQRKFKSVLKLDKNFHLYIHGDRSKIEQGKELDGRKYYKIYYDQES